MVDSYVSGRQQKCLVNGELSWHTVILLIGSGGRKKEII